MVYKIGYKNQEREWNQKIRNLIMHLIERKKSYAKRHTRSIIYHERKIMNVLYQYNYLLHIVKQHTNKQNPQDRLFLKNLITILVNGKRLNIKNTIVKPKKRTIRDYIKKKYENKNTN